MLSLSAGSDKGWGLKFRVSGFGFRVSGQGFRVQGWGSDKGL